ncbi:MAG TPA: carboxypeptidase regulatory-like domain-containing protein [Vicinamibacterales bacterium]|nr:carboxypeptidase regulatory-like domain-containing protein [Vicinamibacterales bacterium]
MRRTLFVCTAAVLLSSTLWAQTAAPARATAKPGAFVIQVTDALGAPLAEAAVTATGPVAREGVTGADGSLRFANMRAGTYRLKFAREGSITLERDVTLRAGESLNVDAALSSAPPAPIAPTAPVAPTAPELGPPGDPKVTPVPLFLEKNFIGGREARKDSLLGCTPTGTATLHQLRDSWLSHTHDAAEEWIYVVAGEGMLRIGATEQKVQAGTFSLVPHTVAHALIPQGRNPLIIISVLSGPPCKSQ